MAADGGFIERDTLYGCGLVDLSLLEHPRASRPALGCGRWISVLRNWLGALA